jgi:nucleotide-binding universal stress UspA family protein
MKFLICVEGSQAADEAAQIGEGLAKLAGAETIRFRVVDSQREAERHRGTGSLLRVGSPVQEILAEAERGNFDLIVIGAHTRHRLAELFVGSTASRLAKQTRRPVLVVKQPRETIQRVLVCTGGEAPGEFCAQWGGRVAAWTGASVTILHVMSQIAFGMKSKLDELDDTAEEAISQGTREGQHLQRAIQLAREAGGEGAVKAKIRHGLVLDEILEEVEAGDYDLVAIGAHYVPGNDPLRGLLLDDIADQIVNQCPRNVLVVRYKR